eukprot:6162154-Prymnesium_polylepis.2
MVSTGLGTPRWQCDTPGGKAAHRLRGGPPPRGDVLQCGSRALARAATSRRYRATLRYCVALQRWAALRNSAALHRDASVAALRAAAARSCSAAGAWPWAGAVVAPRRCLDSNGRPAGRHNGGALRFVQGPRGGGCRHAAAGDGRVEEEGHPGARLRPR